MTRRARGPAALGIALGVLLGIELALRAGSCAPPDDPLLFHLRSAESGLSPFVERPDGRLAIRDDWVSRGNGVRRTRGPRAGTWFLYPGFRPALIARSKPPDTLRVFALGGSTTFGYLVGADEAFPAVLGALLAGAAPGREVEVVNLGCAGWDSGRVANLLPGVLALEPDLLVVYSGHNELLADAAPGAAWALRARLLSASLLVRWIDHALAAVLRGATTESVPEALAAQRAGGVVTPDPDALPAEARRAPDVARVERAAQRYAANLQRMRADAERAGVPIVFARPVANLLYPPGVSAHGPGVDRAAFDAARARAERALAAGELRAALAALERAAALSPQHALTWHRRGRVLLALGKTDAAAAALERAVDLDVRANRLTSALAAAAEASGLPWIDLRPALWPRLDVETGQRLFLDHLHPTAEGHRALAAALLPAAREALRRE